MKRHLKYIMGKGEKYVKIDLPICVKGTNESHLIYAWKSIPALNKQERNY